MGLESVILGETAINTETFETLYPVTVGEVAYVKTTEEPTFVLSIEVKGPLTEVTVRRPVSKDGFVSHLTEGFSLGELESEKAKFMRQLTFTKFSLEQRDLFTRSRQDASKDGDKPAQLNFEGFLN